MENYNSVSAKNIMKGQEEVPSEEEDDDVLDTEDDDDDDDTIARIQRAHYAQAAAMSKRRRTPAKTRPLSQKRKMEAVKNFHEFTKKLKHDTGVNIRSLVGKNMLDLSDFESEEDSKSDSDGLSEEEFVVNPSAVTELEENESFIDPFTGDFVDKKIIPKANELSLSSDCDLKLQTENCAGPEIKEEPKTLSISDIINEGDLDTKNVEIAEVEESELCSEKTAEDLLGIKQEDCSQDFDVTEKFKDMEEISVKPVKKDGADDSKPNEDEEKAEGDDEKKTGALNVRRNIREVMDEKQLDASTLAAQRQESERLARVQEQQRIIREVQRQIAMNRQNKIHQKTLALLQGNSSLLKKTVASNKLNLPNTVLVKLPSGEVKKTTMKQGQVEVTRIGKPTTSLTLGQKILKPDQKPEKKDVVEIVDSSSGDESSSSSSDSDDCIMLSDSEVPASPEPEDDPNNSGLHVNDAYNIPDEQGRVLINIGHPEKEEDIFLAPQIARIIKPHQIGGVRFLFDNIIESVERFSTSTGFGCILAHSMGLGKTLQIVCFTDIFLRHTASKTVLCIMPINTLQNWVAEFNKWLPMDPANNDLAAQGEVRPRNFPIYVLNDSHKTLQMRAKVVKDWTTQGGVLMIGYELYRLLSMKKDKKPRKKRKADAKQEAEKEKDERKTDKLDVGNDDTQGSDSTKQSEDKAEGSLNNGDEGNNKKDDKKEDTPNDEDKKLLDEMYEALVKPGPDLVICDEGHRIKNSHSNISYALKQMRTKRRVVLTGYPLQNNLLEYWCMVDFVRPNYLGSKTEFCNMFERPIQNGQCIDSTPQDIRLMRYRAHVLHSLLVGFVQRRSHAVLQSTLPQKEEFVLLIRLTPLQRKLYDRFMNEVVRSTSVPNPLKAFAICCKIWNHPDVLYNFLKKRSEANAAIEEDLDLEEIGGVTKAGKAAKSKAGGGKRATKPRAVKGAAKKPAATIPPNTASNVPKVQEPNNTYQNSTYPNGPPPYSAPQPYRQNQPEGYQYPNYQNSNQEYYPSNQGYNQNYSNNYYQQPPNYGNNYPDQQFPTNTPNANYNQNYWSGNNYYGNSAYYNNSQYPNDQTQQDYRANPSQSNPNYENSQQYPPNYNQPPSDPSYTGNNAAPYDNQQYNNQQQAPYPQNYQNQPGYPGYNASSGQQGFANQSYPSQYQDNPQYSNQQTPYNPQYETRTNSYTEYPPTSTLPSNPTEQPSVKSEPVNETKPATLPGNYQQPYSYNQVGASAYPLQGERSTNYSQEYGGYPSSLETKPPLGSSGSPITSWPIIKTEVDRIKNEAKAEVKSESDGEVKIEDLDTKKIVKDESKKDTVETPKKEEKNNIKEGVPKSEIPKTVSGSDEDKTPKKGKQKGKGKETKKTENKRGKGKPRGRKDRKSSKEKNDESESEESEKEEKLKREDELALLKKAEEMTYDWAAELLKEYIPGIIENSAKMELFFYIMNESIKLGDRLLLFSQSLFTLNLIEDFLEKNYIPGTNIQWQRNTNYYRLDGSTHALEREKLINEFNANPNVYLFLVSTRAGSLGINLVGANRVIVFDASWNPCHDTQAVCRVYRYGQKKPCFVYRFVMDWCLEKKIYDRQINKQGMADRVVDECNPDAVLSMKEITNLCFDNDEKETEAKDLSEHKDKYIDVIMQGIITKLGQSLSKEPFQHESLLVDRKEKKLSSAEKRLAKRGYELEKKAAAAPKPTTAYRTVRTADGSIVQRPVASVRPMQHGARWIPAEVWRRQGMTAQEMTLPLDVVIPTNSAEKTNIVLKAGQRVMVLKSPKGIYMQLESGKIIAIKTSLKGLGQKPGDKDVGKKVMANRPSTANLPGSLKNNSAITITSKPGTRPIQRVITRPQGMGQKIIRPVLPGQRPDFRNRINAADLRSYGARKIPMMHRGLRPTLPGSLSITKVPKEPRKIDSQNEDSNQSNKVDVESETETQVLDSDDEETQIKKRNASKLVKEPEEPANEPKESVPPDNNDTKPVEDIKSRIDKPEPTVQQPIVLTTDEKLLSEDALDDKIVEENKVDGNILQASSIDNQPSKISLLKTYRHQRMPNKGLESSLSQLERTAIALNQDGVPAFRKNLDNITQSYSPVEEKPATKSRKKKNPMKIEIEKPSSASMSHSVSNLLGPIIEAPKAPEPINPISNLLPPVAQTIPRIPSHPLHQEICNEVMGNKSSLPSPAPLDLGVPSSSVLDATKSVHPMPTSNPVYPSANPPHDNPYNQYPAGYAMGYGSYPNPPYYGGYSVPQYYPRYPSQTPPYPQQPQPSTAPNDTYLPPNPQW